jgi:hypothetical protein
MEDYHLQAVDRAWYNQKSLGLVSGAQVVLKLESDDQCQLNP